MNSFKRMFISLKSQIDHVADEFENHEALAATAIKDLEALGARTKIQLNKVRNMAAQQEKKITELRSEAELWTERAVKVRDQDEHRALECVKRVRATRSQEEMTEKQLQETRKLERRIQSDLNQIRQELQTLKKKKELLSARQNRAQVKAIMDNGIINRNDDARDIFERWENRVVGAEFDYTDLEGNEDSFAGDFEKEEDEVELKAMLDELTKGRPEQAINEKKENENG